MSKLLFAQRFHDFISQIGNSKYLKIYTKEHKFIDGFNTLLFLNFSLAASIFFYLIYLTHITSSEFEFVDFLKLLISISAVVLIKIILERLIARIFDIDNLIDSYIFQKTSSKNYIGLILLPVNIIFLYTAQPSKLIIVVLISLLLIINLLGFISSIKNHQKLILQNIFYFILYLCTLEIGPYLILYKLIVEFKA